MILSSAVALTLFAACSIHVTPVDGYGDIHVSQSASSFDEDGCGTAEMPCKTLPYAAKRCQSQMSIPCNFIIDGGSTSQPFAYIIPGHESFEVGTPNLSIKALDMSFKPTIVCNQTNRKDVCFSAQGRGLQVDSLEFVCTTTSPYHCVVSKDEPMVRFLSGEMGTQVSNCAFHDVSVGGFIFILKNWYVTGADVNLRSDGPITASGCNVYGTNFRFTGNAPVTLQTSQFFSSNFTIDQSGGGGPIKVDGSTFTASNFSLKGNN